MVMHENGGHVLPTGNERRQEARRRVHGRRGDDDVSNDDLRALIAAMQEGRVREDRLREQMDAVRDQRLDKLERFKERALPFVGIATVFGAIVGGLVVHLVSGVI